MTHNKNIYTSELDFDAIKQNLKTYLSGQSQFSDYDFEGSGLSILLDILAYNTHYNALYNNLAVNESFLDSASKRSSVVSKAKELGYIAQSAQSSTAIVNITMTNTSGGAPSFIEIPVNTPFSTNVNGTPYTFYTDSANIAPKNGNVYVFSNIKLKQGTPLTFKYTYSDQMKILIPNKNIDRRSIKVTVQDNPQTSTFNTFYESVTILNITGNSLVFFLKELEDQTYELEFGNGIVGKALQPGNLITITYMICDQDLPNGARAFTFNGIVPANTTVVVNTVSSAAGGSGPENIESIRWNAPRIYAAQNRCVTADDFVSVIMSMFPEALTVSVWGGQDDVTPQYGKVFISVVPRTTDILSDDQKKEILLNIVNPRKALTITAEIVDPVLIKIALSCSFYYNPALTTNTANDLVALVNQTINDYNANSLNVFGSILKYSRLTALIDDADPSITHNITTLKMLRDITPIYNIESRYLVPLNNPIYNSGVAEESILSNGIYTTETTEICYIDDIASSNTQVGALRLFYYDLAGEKINLKTVGSVNYSTGLIDINNITITGIVNGTFTLTIKGQSNDVISSQNQFIRIDPSLTVLTPIIDTPASSYTFSSSRN
jgi:hypothetical protein